MKTNIITPSAALALLIGALLTVPARAAGEMLVPVGEAVGISLRCRGVVVSGFAEVETDEGTFCPAREAGLRPGDVITTLNGSELESGEEFLQRAAAFTGEAVVLGVRRAGEDAVRTIAPRQNRQGVWQLGLWLRDSVQGIGTVTFYDPATGAFGALGHGVSLPEGQGLVEAAGGAITAAEVMSVLPGRRGEPGELCGRADREEAIGRIEQNTACGIFGECFRPMTGSPLPVAGDCEIHPGAAVILATVDSAGPREYAAEIVRVERSGGETRQLTIAVTDPALLRVTGGIVQGMSGSPILQNGKLIGAVTHVLVSDPARGYAISMENMLKASRTLEDAA